MVQVPDDPRIRDAELYGMPDFYDEPECPCCGKRCETIYMDEDENVVGCDCCVKPCDVYEWMDRQREERDYDD